MRFAIWVVSILHYISQSVIVPAFNLPKELALDHAEETCNRTIAYLESVKKIMLSTSGGLSEFADSKDGRGYDKNMFECLTKAQRKMETWAKTRYKYEYIYCSVT